MTVTVCPAIDSVPTRPLTARVSATAMRTCESPDPLPAPVMVIQLAWLVAVHAHPLPVTTCKSMRSSPAKLTLTGFGEIA